MSSQNLMVFDCEPFTFTWLCCYR